MSDYQIYGKYTFGGGGGSWHNTQPVTATSGCAQGSLLVFFRETDVPRIKLGFDVCEGFIPILCLSPAKSLYFVDSISFQGP